MWGDTGGAWLRVAATARAREAPGALAFAFARGIGIPNFKLLVLARGSSTRADGRGRIENHGLRAYYWY